MVTSETMKVCNIFVWSSNAKPKQVDPTGIVDQHKKSLMLEIINSLQILVHKWRTARTIPEVNWDRIRTLDFQEALHSRNDVAKRRQGFSCTLCGEFHDHVSLSHFHVFIQLTGPSSISFSMVRRRCAPISKNSRWQSLTRTSTLSRTMNNESRF